MSDQVPSGLTTHEATEFRKKRIAELEDEVERLRSALVHAANHEPGIQWCGDADCDHCKAIREVAGDE